MQRIRPRDVALACLVGLGIGLAAAWWSGISMPATETDASRVETMPDRSTTESAGAPLYAPAPDPAENDGAFPSVSAGAEGPATPLEAVLLSVDVDPCPGQRLPDGPIELQSVCAPIDPRARVAFVPTDNVVLTGPRLSLRIARPAQRWRVRQRSENLLSPWGVPERGDDDDWHVTLPLRYRTVRFGPTPELRVEFLD